MKISHGFATVCLFADEMRLEKVRYPLPLDPPRLHQTDIYV